MARTGAVTAKQRAFVAALATTASVRDAAARVGISERSGWRYLTTPAVRAELGERQDALLAATTANLVEDMSRARIVLAALMQDEDVPPAVRASAAGRILEAGLRFVELLALAERVAMLEARLAGDDA